jgi:hypothetical protein
MVSINQAEYFCDKRDKYPIYLEENKKYEGSMAESDYKMAKKITKAGQMAGHTMGVFGNKQQRETGHVVGFGSVIASEVMGDEYRVYMRFKCE